MEDYYGYLLAAAGGILVLLVTWKHGKRTRGFDPFGNNFESHGKLLKDYDEDQKYIDKFSK